MFNFKIHIILTSAVALLLLVGCSSESPMQPAPAGTRPADAVGSHNCWGVWQLVIDPARGAIDVARLREGNLHLNAVKFLEPPVNTFLTIENVHFNGKIVELDVGIRHPFLGLVQYTGFDVCGVVITSGSVAGFDDPGVRMTGEGDMRLLNPDGLTRWWNPAEFPLNTGTMFSYQDGMLGVPDAVADFNCTLNAYKYFCDYLGPGDDYLTSDPARRGMFSAGQKNSRHYLIEIGGDGLVFNYAVDACWKFPNGDAPWDAPDDFPKGANRVEAWGASISETKNTLYNDGAGDLGGDLSLSIDVYDHYNAELNSVKVESPGNFDMAVASAPVGGGVGYSTYEIEIVQATPAEGSIDLLVTVESEAEGYQDLLPGVAQAAYFAYTAAVSDTPPTTPDDPGWRQFRHDVVRSGRSKIHGPVTDNVKYSYAIPGSGDKGILGGIVFDSQDRALFRSNDGYIYCVDSSGELAWSYFIGGTWDYCTPFIDDDDNVYVGNSDSGLYHFDASGNLQWSKSYGGGSITTPTVQADGTIVFCTIMGSVVKTDIDGDVIWQYYTGNLVPGGPAIGDDGTIYCSNHNGEVHAVDQDGGKVWATDCGSYEMSATPALGPLGIYIADWGGTVYCLDYGGGIEWSTWLSGQSISSGAAIDEEGFIYIGSRDNRLYCMYAADGDVEWSYDTGGQIGTMSPVLDGAGRVYTGSYNGHFYCFTTSGDLIWDYDCGVPGPNAMYCLSPAIADDGTVAVGCNEGILFAFRDP